MSTLVGARVAARLSMVMFVGAPQIRLGNQVRDNREDHLNDVTDICYFNHVFELNTTLPGASLLTLECWDYDGFGRNSDDLIGKTEIDLEDRCFTRHGSP